jgi:hypothetical protein
LALAEMFSDLSRAVFEAWKRVQARASREARAFAVSATRADQKHVIGFDTQTKATKSRLSRL